MSAASLRLSLAGLRWALGLLACALATGVLVLARDQLTTPTVAVLYLVPVGLSASLWGLLAGVVASVSAFLFFNFFFFPPYFTLQVHAPQDILDLVVFLGVAIFVSQVVGRARASQAAAQAREREAVQLHELGMALARLSTEAGIAQVLAESLHAGLAAAGVEVAVWPKGNEAGQLVRAPAEAAPGTAPQFVVPLLTPRGELGEVRIWRTARLEANEQRLLQTFVGQGSLALEQARTQQAAVRTQVLEESDRLKSALLSSVSHELRTPLASIQAAVTSLRSGAVDWAAPARQDLLAMVEEEVVHLNRLVGNLLDMSRIEAGALKPQRQWNILADIVEGTLTRLRHAAEQHQITVDVPDDLPLVPVDHVLLDQVLTNLVGNSLKYAPAGTTIHIRARRQDERTLAVQVRNQGPPVPAEHLDHIFDKFYRVRAADRVTGTGLGLSICKGIVEAHGGRIWAENQPDGFALNFTLPLEWEGHPAPRVPLEMEA
ncbi:MAG: DUF4118 domain-containing protein [Anaerolineales bacterium]|nr:DUF4118 domain-containing protein [Anaerolineales bacterium]